MLGILYVVATPIGNLEDITQRALRVLREVELIAAEDTRRTRILLDHYQIETSLTSLYEHNEAHKAPVLIRRLEQGASIALVSEAGTPLISDPGFRFVQLAIAHGLPVVPVPGPSAVITALMAAGLPTDRFIFEGFLPKKPGKRRRRLQELQAEPRTTIFYESARRLQELLREIQTCWGDRRIVVARELTKKFEELLRGPISAVQTELAARPPLGEITLVVEGTPAPMRRQASHDQGDPADSDPHG
jgi:16S rRNA (cytidine1402-2'-O)-methyltransferase